MRSNAEQFVDAIEEGGVNVLELADADAQAAIARLVDAFVATPSARWWWEHLNVAWEGLHYGRAREPGPFGLECLLRLVGDRSTETLVVVGQDEGRPAVFRGTIEDVVTAIGETFGFEYVVCDPAATWAIFDNHHQVLVVVGHPSGLGELETLRAEVSDSRNR